MDTNPAYIVTGGFSGIGFAVVRKLLDMSATVHAIDQADSLPILDQPHSGKVHFYPNVDVSSREAVAQTFKSAIHKSPNIRGIANCAGVGAPDTMLPSDEDFNRVMAVNLGGTWNVGTEYLRYVLEGHMDTRSKTEKPSHNQVGSIVSIGSIGSYTGLPQAAPYCASKHAVLGLTRAWAKDFAKKGVRVNCVAPGPTDTPLVRAMAPESVASFVNQVPLARIAHPDEIAETMIFLLSDKASYITGQIIPVDGGLT
ncbi:hypothetical protein N7456_007333 [Penicillium angulare]|uniref:Short-chain dehydrogenase/reductase SDR n=1 Tax=Penicillium angulare TaxID=116970 RepID=A0A9W9FAF1_9EURO|nr:hypothetical protein N7456_007333 [Penicillium angulare]